MSLISRFNRRDAYTEQDYWEIREHRNILKEIFWPTSIEYDGKYVFKRTHEELKEIDERLAPYITNGDIKLMKFKSDKTPQPEEFKDKLPVMIVYSKDKEKQKIEDILKKEGVNDYFWMHDDQSYSIFNQQPSEQNSPLQQ